MPDNQPQEPPAEPKPTRPAAAESVPAGPLPEPDVDPGYDDSGVPTLDSVREKIETRYTTSIGAAELDAETPEGRSIDEQYEARQRAAAERLEEIRESMHRDDGA